MRCRIALGASLLSVIVPLAWTTSAAPAQAATASYSAARLWCSVTDTRAREISGMVAYSRGVYVINDKSPSTIYRIDERCKIVATINVGVPFVDTEDMAVTADGTIWIGDIGGNKFDRTSVAVYRRPLNGPVQTFRLDYPDGAHDAEALMVSRTGQLVIVTKQDDGDSDVYTAKLPLQAASTLTHVANIDVEALRPNGRGSLCVTGGAVSPGGGHFALRTYTTAYEWDAPDGDVVKALRTRSPRPITLAPTLQGEAIAYLADGSGLLTATEKLPAPVHVVSITRS